MLHFQRIDNLMLSSYLGDTIIYFSRRKITRKSRGSLNKIKKIARTLKWSLDLRQSRSRNIYFSKKCQHICTRNLYKKVLTVTRKQFKTRKQKLYNRTRVKPIYGNNCRLCTHTINDTSYLRHQHVSLVENARKAGNNMHGLIA